jgi:AmmeMemoRadiSam system protein B
MMDEYETPIGNIPLDRGTINELYATGAFGWMQRSVDEDEHSIEMQLPYVAKMMQG